MLFSLYYNYIYIYTREDPVAIQRRKVEVSLVVLLIGSYMQFLSACFGPSTRSDRFSRVPARVYLISSSRSGQLEETRLARMGQISSRKPGRLEWAWSARAGQVSLSRPGQLSEARSVREVQVSSSSPGQLAEARSNRGGQVSSRSRW